MSIIVLKSIIYSLIAYSYFRFAIQGRSLLKLTKVIEQRAVIMGNCCPYIKACCWWTTPFLRVANENEHYI